MTPFLPTLMDASNPSKPGGCRNDLHPCILPEATSASEPKRPKPFVGALAYLGGDHAAFEPCQTSRRVFFFKAGKRFPPNEQPKFRLGGDFVVHPSGSKDFSASCKEIGAIAFHGSYSFVLTVNQITTAGSFFSCSCNRTNAAKYLGQVGFTWLSFFLRK